MNDELVPIIMNAQITGPINYAYAIGAQTEHQPAALTSLPGNIWHGRHSSPSAPCTNAQFAQVWSAAGLARCAGSTLLAS